MSRETLIKMALHNMDHVRGGTIERADEVLTVPAKHYYDEERWRLEMRQVFGRMPLMLALTCEMPNPGDYRAMEAAGVPILLARDDSGKVNAFLNSCAHRGAQVVLEGSGNSHRFTCPYHAWSYNTQGELIGVYSPKDFGEVDRSCNGLKELPVLEKAGLIWVIPNTESSLDIASFLCGYDGLLEHFGFENWHLFDRRTVKGPNWKIAYDGYLDFYHLPILHKDTFGPDFPNRAMYYGWGPHQRVSTPNPELLELDASDPNSWPTDKLLDGVWTIFPHVSIAGFDGGGRGVMISQLFPGDTPQESITVQNYVMQNEPPNEEVRAAATEQFEFLKYVVQEEDYATGLRQQRALMTGLQPTVMFGRNEGGGQTFHGWLDRLLKTNDQDLPQLFSET